MSNTFKPSYVPSDIIARWPTMALALWKKSFGKQAAMLLAVALLMKPFPAWSAVVAFLLAPSLFFICFTAAQINDEYAGFSWSAFLEKALPGAARLGQISLRIGVCFGVGIAILYSISSTFSPSSAGLMPPDGMDKVGMAVAGNQANAMLSPPNQFVEFIQFCVGWTEGVMTMIFLGMFIIAIYQGIFGAILHGQQGLSAQLSRQYGWQAWQINAESMEDAVRHAPRAFFKWLALVSLAVICAFQTVYFSPVALLLGTYIPCLAYVAYRSIFSGKHENVPASQQIQATSHLEASLVPIRIR